LKVTPFQASRWCAPLQASPLIATHSPFKRNGMEWWGEEARGSVHGNMYLFYATRQVKTIKKIHIYFKCLNTLNIWSARSKRPSQLIKEGHWKSKIVCSKHFFILHQVSTMQQRVIYSQLWYAGAWEWENLRLRAVCGRGREPRTPIQSIAPSKSRLRDAERGGVEGEDIMGVMTWECVWVRESLCSPHASSSILPSCSLCIASQHQRRTPPLVAMCSFCTRDAISTPASQVSFHSDTLLDQDLTLTAFMQQRNIILSHGWWWWWWCVCVCVCVSVQWCINNKKVTMREDAYSLSLLTLGRQVFSLSVEVYDALVWDTLQTCATISCDMQSNSSPCIYT